MANDELAHDGLPLWPAAERNKGPIAEQLVRRFADVRGLWLEIAAGTGQHALHFARELPHLTYLPTDVDETHLATLTARVLASGLANLLAPAPLDVCQRSWPIATARVVYCANMIHIAPLEATSGLLQGAARVLEPGGHLVTYGPYRVGGHHTSDSNAEFDASLRQRNPAWGVRDTAELEPLGAEVGLDLVERVSMPANNFLLIWRRR